MSVLQDQKDLSEHFKLHQGEYNYTPFIVYILNVDYIGIIYEIKKKSIYIHNNIICAAVIGYESETNRLQIGSSDLLYINKLI